jgi:hypothetical protein
VSPELLAMLALVISGSVFFLTALSISSLGTRISPMPAAIRNPGSNGNGNGEAEHDHYHGFSGRLSAEASLIGRSLQAASLMASALAVFAIFQSGTGLAGSGYEVALSGVLTAAGAIVVQLVSDN